MELGHLKPYQSVLLLEIPPGESNSGVVTKLRDQIIDIVALRLPEGNPPVSGGRPITSVGLQSAFATYIEKKTPSWCLESTDIKDTVNHLVVVSRYHRILAVYTSEVALKQVLARKISGHSEGYEGLVLLSPEKLVSSLTTGEAHTLWLSGIHRRIASKPDNKILSGLDLRFALDPLSDQSYFFTAARSKGTIDDSQVSIGVSPAKSVVWIGPSVDWSAYRRSIKSLLMKIDEGQDDQYTPMPILASPVLQEDVVDDLQGAFDAAILPPEMLDGNATEEEQHQATRWSNYLLEPVDSNDQMIDITIVEDDIAQGRVRIAIDASRPSKIRFTSETVEVDDHNQELVNEFKTLLRDKAHWIKLWFESGHVLADRQIYSVQHRDIPYPDMGWRWANLDAYDVKKEKPNPLAAENIGEQDSLFCWVKNEWVPDGRDNDYPGGWLASNDGSLEIADFIHLDDTATPPVLTLIHVKGANNNSAQRRISTSAYEIVVGQAIKNLRHVDHLLLAENFVELVERRLQDAVWHDRELVDRQEMLDALQVVGASCTRRVCILQPHVRQDALTEGRQATPGSRNRHLVKQLDTLLIAARANAHAMGSEFVVIGAA